ncbi:dihydrofolate reductase [Hydrogenophaga sp.]|uniref:dihydrofolate reductase n=1 Tax=Hydrogenophaga sp. TaxID=1904254 RepID=UPI0027264C2E|nr:dihydrofolate reductase [Hydrogenophaga sp.]MDO9437737.1 dihydrofolate reductase [Hydrogenophaga sp.]
MPDSPTTRLHLIFARAANGVIGKDNALPWHLPEDMAHFKRTTLGHPVIMGRKTWDSLPPKFRPLPGRINIVVTRDANWQGAGASRANSLQEAMSLCPAGSAAWVIGGAQLYAAALPLAHAAVVTEIDQSFEGDAFAPTFGTDWVETAREAHVAANGLPFAFVTLERAAR